LFFTGATEADDATSRSTAAVFAVAGSGALDALPLLAHRVSVALTAGTAILALALVLVVALISP
jgi:hypothetical protein